MLSMSDCIFMGGGVGRKLCDKVGTAYLTLLRSVDVYLQPGGNDKTDILVIKII